MPAKSKAQQMAAGAALAAKKGDKKKSELKGASKGMYESMSKRELERMASSRRKGKPAHRSSTGRTTRSKSGAKSRKSGKSR